MTPTPTTTATGRFEVHAHSYVSGPHGRGGHYHDDGSWHASEKVSHSHDDGDVPHRHPDTGPATFTIDKDEWFMATGLKGGGRKKFTKKPSGEQLDYIEPTQDELTFRVLICAAYTDEHVRAGIDPVKHAEFVAKARAAASGDIEAMQPGKPGRGGAAVANMALSFGMTPIYEVES